MEISFDDIAEIEILKDQVAVRTKETNFYSYWEINIYDAKETKWYGLMEGCEWPQLEREYSAGDAGDCARTQSSPVSLR